MSVAYRHCRCEVVVQCSSCSKAGRQGSVRHARHGAWEAKARHVQCEVNSPSPKYLCSAWEGSAGEGFVKCFPRHIYKNS